MMIKGMALRTEGCCIICCTLDTAPPCELSEEDMSQIQMGEGETLEEIKAKLKPKKSNISAEMLDTANSYDDKVALVRMIVAEDAARVASVLKGMIRASM